MSVIFIEPAGKEGGRGDQEKTELIDYYKALTSDWDDGVVDLMLFRPDLCPLQPHPTYPLAIVDTFEPERIEHSLAWDIVIRYTTARQKREEEKNPLARRARITTNSADRKRLRTRDNKGRPVMNLAGELYDDPPPESEEADLIFNVAKNVPTKLPAWILDYRNAVNTDVVKVRGLPFPVGTLKLKDLAVGDDDEENGIPFCELSFKLHHCADGWTELIPHRGRYQLLKKKVFNLDKQKFVMETVRKQILVDGAPPADPQFLDKDGKWIEKATADNIFFQEWDFSNLKPFGVLPLK